MTTLFDRASKIPLLYSYMDALEDDGMTDDESVYQAVKYQYELGIAGALERFDNATKKEQKQLKDFWLEIKKEKEGLL